MVRPLEEVIQTARSLPANQLQMLIDGIERQPLQYFRGMADRAGERDLVRFKAQVLEKLKRGDSNGN
jgi:hypothetical protein